MCQDRVHSAAEGVPQIWDAGLQLFIERIIRSPLYSIQQHMLSAVLRQIRLERDGYPVNRSAIKGCIEVYRSLNEKDGQSVYKRELEPSILKETERYFKLEGETLISSCNASEYLRRVSSFPNLYQATWSLIPQLDRRKNDSNPNDSEPITTSASPNLSSPPISRSTSSHPTSPLSSPCQVQASTP